MDVETQTEPRRHRARVTMQAWRPLVELKAHWTEVEVWTQKTVVEPE